MNRSFTGGMRRLVRSSWARTNARLHIVATDEESAYYAWVDEYLDRLHAEAVAARRPGRPAASTIDEVTSASR